MCMGHGNGIPSGKVGAVGEKAENETAGETP
jgi:hypothetical protein